MISIAVLNLSGKLEMEYIVEIKAITIVQFVQGLRGDLHIVLRCNRGFFPAANSCDEDHPHRAGWCKSASSRPLLSH